MVNSDASSKAISIFNNIDFSDIDFASVANVIHPEKIQAVMELVNEPYDEKLQTIMESVINPCDYASLSDSSSCDSYESIEDNICKGCTEHRTENFISDDETDLHKLFDDKVAEMNRTWHHCLHAKDACFLFTNIILVYLTLQYVRIK